jgi:hypothetical protein
MKTFHENKLENHQLSDLENLTFHPEKWFPQFGFVVYKFRPNSKIGYVIRPLKQG